MSHQEDDDMGLSTLFYQTTMGDWRAIIARTLDFFKAFDDMENPYDGHKLMDIMEDNAAAVLTDKNRFEACVTYWLTGKGYNVITNERRESLEAERDRAREESYAHQRSAMREREEAEEWRQMYYSEKADLMTLQEEHEELKNLFIKIVKKLMDK